MWQKRPQLNCRESAAGIINANPALRRRKDISILNSTAPETKRNSRRVSRARKPHVSATKQPLNNETYYTARELTDKASAFYQFSPATLFRNLSKLDPKYVGRKLLIRGESVLALIEGRVQA